MLKSQNRKKKNRAKVEKGGGKNHMQNFSSTVFENLFTSIVLLVPESPTCSKEHKREKPS